MPDKSLRAWRGWLRGEFEVGGPDLRRRFDECRFTEQQIEFLWKLIFNVADYQMHLLMDFIEFMTTVHRLRIEVFAELQPSAEDPDVPAEPALQNVIADGDMFPGQYIGWSEQFSEMSDDWAVEKSRDPAAPPRPRPEPPPPDARRCSFCGSDEYANYEVWESPMEGGAVICTDCARLAMMFVGGKDDRPDAGSDQAET